MAIGAAGMLLALSAAAWVGSALGSAVDTDDCSLAFIKWMGHRGTELFHIPLWTLTLGAAAIFGAVCIGSLLRSIPRSLQTVIRNPAIGATGTLLALCAAVWMGSALGITMDTDDGSLSFTEWDGNLGGELFYIPLWTLTLGAAMLFGTACLSPSRARPKPGLCPRCAYDLTGISGPCPECGNEQEHTS